MDKLMFKKESKSKTTKENKLKRKRIESEKGEKEFVSKMKKIKNSSKILEKINSQLEESKLKRMTNLKKLRVRLSKQKETQTLDTRYLFNISCEEKREAQVDSSGRKFDRTHFARNLCRHSILKALENGNIPLGARNPLSTAQRIEAKVYNVFKNNMNFYRNQCNMCSAYLNDKDNREIRLNVLMGRIEPECFAFMPEHDLELRKMIDIRIKFKEQERKEKLKIMSQTKGRIDNYSQIQTNNHSEAQQRKFG